MMKSVDYPMTAIYCFVDEFFKGHARLAQWRRSPHAQPQFSDAEVLTVALLQGVLEVATLKQTYPLVAQNWRARLAGDAEMLLITRDRAPAQQVLLSQVPQGIETTL